MRFRSRLGVIRSSSRFGSFCTFDAFGRKDRDLSCNLLWWFLGCLVQRRDFIKSAVLTAAASRFPGVAPAEEPVDEKVKTVLVVFKCHLDVGFTDTQANVMNTYFKKYYPQAMDLGARSRQAHADRYVGTTGSISVKICRIRARMCTSASSTMHGYELPAVGRRRLALPFHARRLEKQEQNQLSSSVDIVLQ